MIENQMLNSENRGVSRGNERVRNENPRNEPRRGESVL